MNGRPKLLLIDDNNNTLDLLEVFLFNDYELVTAENGFEGLTTAERELPDLILTDIMMPVMDGIAFFNELKRRERTDDTPVIAVTSFAEQTTTKSLLSVGFAAVIAKPFNREELLETIDAQLHSPEDESSDDSQEDSPPATTENEVA